MFAGYGKGVGIDMNVRNCRRCGKIFNYVAGVPICPICREKEEEKFQEVKAYVWDHHAATMDMISEDCGVDVQQIRQWVREERLCFTDDSPVGITCENCGAMIKTGRYCEKCKKEMAMDISNAYHKTTMQPVKQKKADRENPKMRFLDR